MEEKLKEVRLALIDALEENDKILLKVGINMLDTVIYELAKSNNIIPPVIESLDELIEWCFNTCNTFNSEELHEILDKINAR